MDSGIKNRSTDLPSSGEECNAGRLPIALAFFALACLVSVAFFPLFGYEFTELDVPHQVTNNPHIRAITWKNLTHIFTSRSATSSYYPIRTLTYAIDYGIWGVHPGGFKLTNTLFHLTNVFLVFWLILRLFRHPDGSGSAPEACWDVSVAAFSAGIFAVHPVVVEPVAWVPGREELLMTLGALACFHAHLTARRSGADGAGWSKTLAWHVCAAAFCAVACLSNAVGAVIPLVLTAWDSITLPRPKLWKTICGTCGLWFIGVATIVIKRLGDVPDTSHLGAVFSGEWSALVLSTYWLNLKTLLWPAKLAFYHECFVPASFLETNVILGGIAFIATCVVLWKLRRPTLVLFGFLWFGLTLAPCSQICNGSP